MFLVYKVCSALSGPVYMLLFLTKSVFTTAIFLSTFFLHHVAQCGDVCDNTFTSWEWWRFSKSIINVKAYLKSYKIKLVDQALLQTCAVSW